MIPNHNYLIVTALGIHRPDIISELSRACLHCGCNLLHSKINVLGQDVAIMLFLSGNWGAIAKMEATFQSLELRLGLTIQTRRTSGPVSTGPAISYSVQIVAIDQAGILNGLTNFLFKHAVHIEEISAHTYTTHTNTRMVGIQLKISVPDKMHLATLREQFMSYCDDHNLDGFMEPVRS